jgi:hypothetical protein
MWREEVLARAGRIEMELAAFDGRLARNVPAGFARTHVLERTETVRRIVGEGDAAGGRADPVGSNGHRRRPRGGRHVPWRERWSGRIVEDCWLELRLAEEALVHLAPGSQLPTIAHDALNHARYYLGAGDERVDHLKDELAEVERDGGDPEGLRGSIVPVLSGAHEASDRTHRDLRSFQNQLRVLAAVLIGMAVVIAVLAGTVLDDDLARLVPALIDGTASHAGVPVALAAGALGALFSAVPSLAQIPEKSMPFNPIREQAVLKVAVGAWSGLVGMLVVQAGLGTAVADTRSLAGYVIVAALFGASQEAITRFADHKATGLTAAPS